MDSHAGPLQRLEWSVRALAQPPEVQRKLFPSFVCVPDELALDFEEGLDLAGVAASGLTRAQKAALDELDRIISSVSGPAHPEVWADEALEDREEWRLIRKAAQDLIRAMGWTHEPPPSDRGAIYIGSDA
jgi:hypothetical protein